MARVNHNNFNNTLNDIADHVRNYNIIHLYADDAYTAKNEFRLNQKQIVNFGSLSYLGLESDERVKRKSAEYIMEYGTQSVMSRTFMTSSILEEVEHNLARMYGYPTILYSRVSLAHMSVIPSLITSNDAIILDQQVHMSVQTAVQVMRMKNVTIDMIKHSNLDMLETKIKEIQDKYDKIYYMADGIYSMFGDVAPIKELIQLVNKYPKLHLYIDDAHGMSWKGKNGTGYAFSEFGHIMPPNTILITTLSKGFGAHGGCVILPTEKMRKTIMTFGGPLSYSLPQSPADCGACVASSEIHLSPEIYEKQAQLKERIEYCNALLADTGLPIVSNPETPIFYLGMGLPQTSYKMVKALQDRGYYTNPGLFPAVPIKNNGVRFGISNNLTKDNIYGLVEAMKDAYPEVLNSEGKTDDAVKKMFKLNNFRPFEMYNKPIVDFSNKFQLEIAHSIDSIDREEWNDIYESKGVQDYGAYKMFESVYRGNLKDEHNWDFYYFMVRDENGKLVVSCPFTVALSKDDMLSQPEISEKIEEIRTLDPYYLTSKVFISGTIVTGGDPFYVDKTNVNWRKAVSLLIDKLNSVFEESEAKTLFLRDFGTDDVELIRFLMDIGFFPVDLPNYNVVDDIEGKDLEAYMLKFNAKGRYRIKREVLNHLHKFKIEIKDKPTSSDIDIYYDLISNVKTKNVDINLFDFPKRLFTASCNYKNWEFIEIKSTQNQEVVGVIWAYKEKNSYTPLYVGLNYSYIDEGLYKVSVFSVLKRALASKKSIIFYGYSADDAKRKFGAKAKEKKGLLQLKENFKLEFLEISSFK